MSYLLNGKPVTLTFYVGVPFDNKYEHHLFREIEQTITENNFVFTKSAVSMKKFLDVYKTNDTQEYKFDRIKLTGEYNFDYSNNLITSLVVSLPKQYVNSNYLIVEDTSGDNIFYYFITSYNVLNASETEVTLKLQLECDVIATYGKTFMNEILDKPLYTERKHCQRIAKGENAFQCNELSLSEEVTYNCKPSVVKEVYDFKLKDLPTRTPLWCYITRTDDANIGIAKYLGIDLPTTTFCFPVVDAVTFKFIDYTLELQPTISHSFSPVDTLKTIFDNPNVVGIKFSPFPPFKSLDGSFEYNLHPSGAINCSIFFNEVEYIKEVNGVKYFKLFCNENTLTFFMLSETSNVCFVLLEQNVAKYELEKINENNLFPIPPQIDIQTLKTSELEPKLLFSPCTKYELYHRSGKTYEIYPELVSNHQPLTNNYELFSYTTFALIDNVISTFIKIGEEYNTTWEVDKVNRGLILSNNYTFPNGKDALKTFQATQQTQHTSATLGSAITSGIGMIGGFASGNYVVGALGAVGLVTSIGGALSKYNDIANTPDQLLNVGSNVYQDITYYQQDKYENGGMLPKIIVSELTIAEKEMLLDYFYHNGYTTQRMCSFTKSLNFENVVDKRLLTRTNFNYVKLNENLTYHLTGCDLPSVVKEKLNTIFNNGITLWTLYNYGNPRPYGQHDSWESDIAPYFMKDTYENVEIDL